MSERIIEINEIKDMLPHRYPFLFVDRVLEVSETGIKAIKNVTVNEEYFNGHFPAYPVMPGVLQVEALVQAAGIWVVLRNKERGTFNPDAKTLFTSIEEMKFKRPVVPGDQLVLEAEYIKDKLGVWWFKATASVDGKVACTGIVSAAIR